MANFANQYKPSRLNLDKSTKFLLPTESFYLLNHDVNNSNAFGKGTPFPANEAACDLELPAGENYSPNNHYSPLTNENYTWHYNSNNVHFISRINGDGECVIVYNGECLKLSADPKHEIAQFRGILDVDYLCNKVPGGALKRLIWVDGTDTPMGCLDVEASIATNFFTTPFFDICGDECAYIQLCVPEIKDCIKGEWIPVSNADSGKGNLMLDKGFKFAIRHIYYDQRASELSDRSTLYFQDSKGCFDNSEGYPRCIKFRLPVGNPMVEKIEFYVSEDGGLTWFLRDTIEKYKKYNSTQQYWYQRDLSETVSSTFSESDCSFDYVFCNDKQRIPIDPKLLTRVTNPIPREVQGIFRVKDTIAAFNYVSGTCPVDKSELDKITLNINCNDTPSCETEFVEVTARAIVYLDVVPDGAAVGISGLVFRMGGFSGGPDDKTDPAYFGFGLRGFDQGFKDTTRNFIVYIEGTELWGEMEQWSSAPYFNNTKKVGVMGGYSDEAVVFGTKAFIANGNFFYSEYKFKVPKGTKGFLRLVSHHQTSGSGSNQNTSTHVAGTLGENGLKSFQGVSQIFDRYGTSKEIYFDTCDGDFDNFDAFIVNDLRSHDDSGYSGYITDKNDLAVEGAQIYTDASTYQETTDWNGFYFFHHPDTNVSIKINVEQSCVFPFSTIDTFASSSAVRAMANTDRKIDSQYYIDQFYEKVNVVALDCNDSPIRGLRVAMSGSKYKVTDSSGVAHFRLRNYAERNREITAVLMDKNACFNLDCLGACNPCMPSVTTTLAPCFEFVPETTITPAIRLNINGSINGKRSLKKGGIYDLAIVVEGDCGKISAAYPITTWNIPRLQEIGSYSTCTYSYNTNGALFPSWAKRAKIVRSVNLSPFTLQWVVDDIERTPEGQLVLTIQSLNDYNSKYNFKTNTIYQFSQGDRVEFIRNGNGDVFDVISNGILNYQILSPFNNEDLSGVTNDSSFFNQIKITDDGKLDHLEKGAVIQIMPLALSTPLVTYYEMCANFTITNGVADIPQGVFDTFDTYLVNRQIGSFASQYFEHRSPSDFWGETTTNGISNFLSDIGKAHFLNPYENEKRYPRNISINSSTQLNYFGDYIKTLDAEEQGGVTAINVKDDAIGLALCENDSFLFQISDDLLRIGTDGIVRAAPVDSIISNPEPKTRGEYGVSYEDIGSIFFGDGFATFADSKNNAYVIHNYSVAQICGLATNQQNGLVESSCNSWFKKRMQQKANFNKTATNFLDHYRWSVGQNKTNNVIYLTLKSLRHPGINNAKFVYEYPNETITYTPISDAFLGFVSFTPESYSQLSLATDDGCSFLTFLNSVPYIHPINTDTYNEFFGVACDELVGITITGENKIIIPISGEIQSGQMWFVHNVSTEKATFRSEVPPIRVKLSNGKWNFAFLNDINSRGGLYNGVNARSYYINVLFIKDNTVNNQYGSIDNAKRRRYNELDQILIKFMTSEQSGFTENL